MKNKKQNKSDQMRQNSCNMMANADSFGTNIRSIRREQGLTQKAFANAFGFSIGAVRDWEQGRKRPDRSAQILLAVIQSSPEVVTNAVVGVEKGNARS